VEQAAAEILDRYRIVRIIRAGNRQAEHQVEKLLEAVKEQADKTSAFAAGTT
jgi:hypothetical protein